MVRVVLLGPWLKGEEVMARELRKGIKYCRSRKSNPKLQACVLMCGRMRSPEKHEGRGNRVHGERRPAPGPRYIAAHRASIGVSSLGQRAWLCDIERDCFWRSVLGRSTDPKPKHDGTRSSRRRSHRGHDVGMGHEDSCGGWGLENRKRKQTCLTVSNHEQRSSCQQQ